MPGIADTTAAPAMLTIGRLWWRRTLLVSPLTIGDLGWYDRMGGHDHSVGRQDMILLIWLSLRRYQSWLGWNRCRRMFRAAWRYQRAFHIIMEVNPSSFGTDTEPEPEGEPESKGAYNGHAAILRSLAIAFRWPPGVACDLTLDQAELYLASGDKGASAERMYFSSREEALAYVETRRKEKEKAGE